MFDVFDSNGDGRMSATEMLAIVQANNPSLSDEVARRRVRTLMTGATTDGSEITMSFPQFLDVATRFAKVIFPTASDAGGGGGGGGGGGADGAIVPAARPTLRSPLPPAARAAW